MEGPHSVGGAALSIVLGSEMMRHIGVMALLLFPLAACGGSTNDRGEGGVTRTEADALDQAAEQLDQQQVHANVSDAPSAE